MQIKLFKLVTGELIISEYKVSEDKLSYIFINPQSVNPVPQRDGTLGIALMDFVLCSKDSEMSISINKVLLDPIEPIDSIRSLYKENINKMIKQRTGIEIVGRVPGGR